MSDKMKVTEKAVAIGEIALAGIALTLKVVGLFRGRVA